MSTVTLCNYFCSSWRLHERGALLIVLFGRQGNVSKDVKTIMYIIKATMLYRASWKKEEVGWKFHEVMWSD